MKTLAALLFACLFLLGPPRLSAANQPIGFDIMLKHDLHIKGPANKQEMTLPELSGPNWGLKQSVLNQAGFDLRPYVGQTVSLIRYNLLEKYYQTTRWGTESYELSLWVIAKNDKALGAFVTCRWPGGLIPGVFAVNDPGIKAGLW